jgi:hypothetical protein
MPRKSEKDKIRIQLLIDTEIDKLISEIADRERRTVARSRLVGGCLGQE